MRYSILASLACVADLTASAEPHSLAASAAAAPCAAHSDQPDSLISAVGLDDLPTSASAGVLPPADCDVNILSDNEANDNVRLHAVSQLLTSVSSRRISRATAVLRVSSSCALLSDRSVANGNHADGAGQYGASSR